MKQQYDIPVKIDRYDAVILTRSNKLKKPDVLVSFFEGYTYIDTLFIQKANVSPEAKLLIIYLCSLPADFIVTLGYLKKTLKMGRHKLDRMIKELINEGYMCKKQRRNKVGNRLIKSLNLYSYYPEYKNSVTSSR
jgi:hypothetical protein